MHRHSRNEDIELLARKFSSSRYDAKHPSLSITRLAGTTNEVFRISAVIGQTRHWWVAKHASAAETRVLKLLAAAMIPDVPEILDEIKTPNGHFILMPEYRGSHGDFGDAIPDNIIQCLARVHVYYRGAPLELQSTDRKALQRLFDSSFGHLDKYPTRAIRAKLAGIKDAVECFAQVATSFSSTLVHWDVHPLNIIDQGKNSKLIDWGQARLGPAMIDLANVIKWESSDFIKYTAAYESISGEPFDLEANLTEYNWCRAITQVKYLPFAAKHGGTEAVERMVGILSDYQKRIAQP